MRVRKSVAAAETTIKNFEAEARLHRSATAGDHCASLLYTRLIVHRGTQVGKLNHIISEADSERFRQKKEYDIVINERDILGTQLIRRNDELALLAEKLKVPPGRLLASPLFLSSSLPRYPPLRPRPPTGGAFSGAAEDDLQGRDRVPRAAGGRAGAQAALQRTAARPIHP